MLKALVLSAVLFAGVSASAASTYVYSNVFTASGAGGENYFKNLNALNAEFKKVSSVEMGKLFFNGATVQEDGSVDYSFHRLESESVKEICWSTLTFKRTGDNNTPVISNVKAKLDCYQNQD
jgi:hypothetical protein